jgi:hypothetical protein
MFLDVQFPILPFDKILSLRNRPIFWRIPQRNHRALVDAVADSLHIISRRCFILRLSHFSSEDRLLKIAPLTEPQRVILP